jgi:Tol biopolymer transport system component
MKLNRVYVRLSVATVVLVIIPVLLQHGCKDNDDDNGSHPRPYISAHSPAWSPDGATIIFAYTPLTKTNDTTYVPQEDSSGWWFIAPNGANLAYFLYLSCGNFDWHPNGEVLITYPGWGYPSLYRLNINDTSITEIGFFANGAATARYSSDGFKIAVAADDGNQAGIWIMDEDGHNARFLLDNIGAIFDWSDDGHYIAFEDRHAGLSLIDTNGNNELQLVAGSGLYSPPAFSPDGQKIVFDMRFDIYDDYELYTIDCDGTNLKKLATGRNPRWSPDGSQIVFTKYSFWGDYDEGNGQLWIMDDNGTNQRQLTLPNSRK